MRENCRKNAEIFRKIQQIIYLYDIEFSKFSVVGKVDIRLDWENLYEKHEFEKLLCKGRQIVLTFWGNYVSNIP